MSDKVWIISGLVSFWTGDQGVLRVVNGKVVLDKVKDFNRARLFRNAGVNMFRELRRGVVAWGAPKGFDWQDEGYWEMLREHFAIEHNPFQGANPPPGADIPFEIFDECGGDASIFYSDPAKARRLIQMASTNLRDLSYVKLSTGNEMNSPTAVAFSRDIVFPEFKKIGRIPFAYGAAICASGRGADAMEEQKIEAAKAWDNTKAHNIFREIHAIVDDKAPHFIKAVKDWINEDIPIFFSDDGAVQGKSPCDIRNIAGWWGPAQIGPSPEQTKAMMKYVFDRATKYTLPNGAIKYGFENLSIIENDACTVKTLEAMSDMYAAKFGAQPFGRGKFPNNWKDPAPIPEPPPVPIPEPPIPPVPEPPLPPEPPQYTLSVTLGDGVVGTPTATVKVQLFTIIDWSYAVKPGYENLQVKIDGVVTSNAGKIDSMKEDHTLIVSATPIVISPPPPPPAPPPPQFTLLVTLGVGTTGTPSATAKYDNSKAIDWSYTAKPGYENLQVKLDGIVTANIGKVGMRKDHSLIVSATPIVTPPPTPPPPPECKIGETKTEKCWDGSEIITHICKDDKWQATGTTCPIKPTKQTLWQRIIDVRHWTSHGWLWFTVIATMIVVLLIILL